MKKQECFGAARYLTAGEEGYPYIRQAFSLDEAVASACLRVSVLGFGEVYCNGHRVNRDLYITPYSQYNRQRPQDVNEPFRNDAYFTEEHSYTVYAAEYDLTPYLRAGENVLGFVVAGGWYRSGKDKNGNWRNYGSLAVAFRLELRFASGRVECVVSDESARTHPGFLLLGGVFGEEQDERLELADFSAPAFPAADWAPVHLRPAPEAEYLVEGYPKQIVEKTLPPTLLREGAGYKIYDVGCNTTGFPVIRTESEANAELCCLYSEAITPEGELDEAHIHGQRSRFVTDGRREHALRFTWHGFRYFKLTYTGRGEFSCPCVKIVHSDVKNTSQFSCSDPLLTRLYRCYVQSQLTNYQSALPTDCPHIERKGYTGDGQLVAECGMLLFDSRLLYRKWLRDIADGQDRISGHVPYTAPIFIGCGGGPGGWGIAIVNLPYFYYRAYGEREVLEEFYPKMLRYLDYLQAHSEGGLVTAAQPGAWCLGEWCTPGKVELPAPFVNTCFHAIALSRVAEIARLLGREQEAAPLLARREAVLAALLTAYRDESGDFCQNRQGANAFALQAGAGDAETRARLLAFYRRERCLNVGIFGLDFLAATLFEAGEGDLFLSLLHAEGEGTFSEWKETEATTLFESPRNARSYNHPMFGSVVKYLFRCLLGIRYDAPTRTLCLAPMPLVGVPEASGSVDLPCGRVGVSLRRESGQTAFCLSIPAGVEARFCYAGTERRLTAGEHRFCVPERPEA